MLLQRLNPPSFKIILVFLSFTDPQNKSNIDLIESAIFVFCLDTPLPGVNSQKPPTAGDLTIASARALHGSGSAYSSCNRWFDHTNQVAAVKCYACIVIIVVCFLELPEF